MKYPDKELVISDFALGCKNLTKRLLLDMHETYVIIERMLQRKRAHK